MIFKILLNRVFLAIKKPYFLSIGKNADIHYSSEIKNKKYISIGNNVCIDKESYIQCPEKYIKSNEKKPIILIEDGTRIGRRAVISGVKKIHIHENVLFGPNVYISDHCHNYENISLPIKCQGISGVKPVEIKENTWIGINACILPGCTIGKNCVIGANSVVTKSFPDYCVIAGAPAKIIKRFNKGKWIQVNG